MSKCTGNNIKVSVVVPFYNTEAYLADAIESLLSQTLKEIEIILIDDGSSDRSGKMADDYAEKYTNITVKHQKNQGVSVARNLGIEVAVGEYITFIDSDDWVDPATYKEMYMIAKQYDCDIVACNLEEVGRISKRTKFPITVNQSLLKEQIQEEVLSLLIKSDSFASPCNKIYRSDIISRNKIYFPEGISIGEDYYFNLCIFSKIHRFLYIPQAYYHYRYVQNSAVNKYKAKKLDIYKELWRMKSDLIEEWSFICDKFKKEYSSRWFIDKALTCIYMEVDCRGIWGVTEGYRLVNDPFVRERITEITESPFYCNRFLNYIFDQLKKKNYFMMLLAIYYSKFIAPVLGKIRGVKNEKKTSLCN